LSFGLYLLPSCAMTLETIYVSRHGFRMNWTTQHWTPVTGTARDPPLAAFGETQAEELAAFFESLPEDERPTALFCSPFYRCLQTANPVAKRLGIPFYIEHGVGEWYSPIVPNTGLHPRPQRAHALQKHFPAIDDSWNPPTWLPSRKGETIAELHERTAGFLRAFATRVGTQHKRVILLGHAASAIALVQQLVGDAKLPLRVGCCTVSTLVRREGAEGIVGAYEPVMLGSGHFLAQGVQRDWGFEDVEVHAGEVILDPGEPNSEHDADTEEGLQVWGQQARM